jgi:hypothetical protein
MEQRLALRVGNCRAAFREPEEMSAMRIYVFKSEAVGHVVLWRENYRPAIFDFCNNIGQLPP